MSLVCLSQYHWDIGESNLFGFFLSGGKIISQTPNLLNSTTKVSLDLQRI